MKSLYTSIFVMTSFATILLFQNCSPNFTAELLSSGVKQKSIDNEWQQARNSFTSYMQNITPQSLYPLYNVQLSTGPFLIYALETQNQKWLMDLVDIYSLSTQHLSTTNKYLFYYPIDFDASGFTTAYRTEKTLDRPYRMWIDAPVAGSEFSVGIESTLVSAQFLYPIIKLIWYFAQNKQLRDPKVEAFINTFWTLNLEDHLLRWIFNEGTLNAPNTSKIVGSISNPPGYGPFQLKGWGCNYGDFNHSERVRYLTDRRFGTNYFDPLYGSSSPPNRPYCNSIWDTDLWILANVAHTLAAHQLAPDVLPISENDYTRLKTHLQNGIQLVLSRITYQTATDFNGQSVETAQWALGGFDGHNDYNYTGDLNPSFPGYTTEGGSPTRPPLPAPNVGWDISHARRLVQFFWTIEKLNEALDLRFPIQRVMQGMSNQLAYVVFNKNFSDPKVTNFLDGTNGWYRVNYLGRLGFGYAPYDWSMSRSVLTSGYGFWAKYNPDIAKMILSVEDRESYNSSWSKIEIWPALPSSHFQSSP